MTVFLSLSEITEGNVEKGPRTFTGATAATFEQVVTAGWANELLVNQQCQHNDILNLNYEWVDAFTSLQDRFTINVTVAGVVTLEPTVEGLTPTNPSDPFAVTTAGGSAVQGLPTFTDTNGSIDQGGISFNRTPVSGSGSVWTYTLLGCLPGSVVVANVSSANATPQAIQAVIPGTDSFSIHYAGTISAHTVQGIMYYAATA